jgi:hypothetical protein
MPAVPNGRHHEPADLGAAPRAADGSAAASSRGGAERPS